MTRGARISPTPRRTTCDPPRPVSTHATRRAGPGGGGHSYDRCDELFDSFHSWAVALDHPSSRFRVTSPTPRRTTCDTPAPTTGAVGIHTSDATNYCDSFHSWAVGIKPPFAEASGDEPPRHADACHPSAEGNFVPRRYWGSGRHILTQMGTWAVG